ncbi:hypothetical protein EOL96_00940 [Candidatus Saccharibacteria bacterium]|nr:hypothetical protein [Candidatus Saccharibacteria bacterium]
MTRWWQYVSTVYPWRVAVVSLLLLVVSGWYAIGLFDGLSQDEMSISVETSSSVANAKIEEKFGVLPAAQIILFERNDVIVGDSDSSAYQAEIERIVAPLREQGLTVQTYADQPSPQLLSRDKSATYAIVFSNKGIDETYAVLRDFAATADESLLSVSIGGEAASIVQTTQAANEFLVHAEMISTPILILLLFFFFRSVVAAVLPLVMSVVTIIGAFAIARIISQFMTIDTYAVNVITILGIGLSIDYALLSVSRFREELKLGGVDRAVKIIIATTGRTIFFSGITVIACLLALLVFPIEMLRSIAVGVTAAVAMAMAFTIVVLPALLKIIGTKIDLFHLPLKRSAGPSRFWQWAARMTTSHPIAAMTFGIAVVAVVTVPISSFRVGPMDYAWLARGSSPQHVAQYLSYNFDSRSPSVAALVVLPQNITEKDKIAVGCNMTTQLKGVAGVESVMSATPIAQQGITCETLQQMALYGSTSPQLQELIENYATSNALRFDVSLYEEVGSESTSDALAAIRQLQPLNGELYVGGAAAVFADTNKLYYDAIPWAAAIVIVSMMILLTLSLRSITLPLQAIVINSVALVVSMAVIVGIFQLGWFQEFTGWSQTSGIALAAPVLVVSVAFGLAMDYSVFLYSRMREVYDKTGDTKKAIIQGMVKTGPIITAAALALFVVVASFAASSVMFMQIIGVGLAVAVLVDAFFVRLVLVPSIMMLMGKTSWYSPKWLSRWSIRHE